MTLQPHKRSDTKPDVIQHGAQTAALRAFNQTLLFQSAMIHFNAPRAYGKIFPLHLAHCFKARRPVFRRAVCGKDAKYFDFAKSLEPNNRPPPASSA